MSKFKFSMRIASFICVFGLQLLPLAHAQTNSSQTWDSIPPMINPNPNPNVPISNMPKMPCVSMPAPISPTTLAANCDIKTKPADCEKQAMTMLKNTYTCPAAPAVTTCSAGTTCRKNTVYNNLTCSSKVSDVLVVDPSAKSGYSTKQVIVATCSLAGITCANQCEK